MIPPAEMRDSLWGAWRLAHLDATGMRWFNLSSEGFFRSFFVAALIAPPFLLVAWLRSRPEPDPATVPYPFEAHLVGYPLLWLIFPLLLAGLARPLGLTRHYATAVIAFNWAQAVIMAALLPIAVLDMTGALGPFGALLYLIAYTASLYYTWFVLRTALETTGGTAVALTLATELLGLLVQRSVGLLFGV